VRHVARGAEKVNVSKLDLVTINGKRVTRRRGFSPSSRGALPTAQNSTTPITSAAYSTRISNSTGPGFFRPEELRK
jgi:hypothetical protein